MAELYQIVGSILRDVAQARFTSDMYSRQISFAYENDSLLRRFPVPRAEIEEVEFNLPFVVKEVTLDDTRHQSRNAAIGRIFDDSSLRIVRAGLLPTQQAFHNLTKDLTSDPKDKDSKIVADRFRDKILSDTYRNDLHGRLLRYLNEHTGELLSRKDGGPFDVDQALEHLTPVIKSAKDEPEVKAFEAKFQPLSDAFEQAKKAVEDEVKKMAAAVNSAYDKYPDYKVEAVFESQTIQANPAAVSYIKVKAAIKNYHWSKVDVDSKEMRNLRTLVPE